MKNNLPSMGQLLEKGFSMSLASNLMKVFDQNKRLILKVPLSNNRTFKVDIQVAEFTYMAAAVSVENWLWHFRFGHLNFRSLCQLQQQKMVFGLPCIKPPQQLCEACIKGKQPRSSFKSYVPTRATDPLAVVYSDVCGPFEVPSLGGNIFCYLH